ncbi:uncharacterized protein [Montipora capricornis]|uniref:uncharacterized protein isoform X2 n=1 Tax=Montipora capricornis TaxID=246305 RepID=UPI0035F12A53
MEELMGLEIFKRRFLAVVLCAVLMPHSSKTAVEIISPAANQIIRYKNQSVLFNCTVSAESLKNNTSFEWLRNNALFLPNNRKDTLLWSSFELQSLSGGEGEYFCNYGISQASVMVYLAAKPKARNVGDHSPIVTMADEPVVLQCEADGWPKPQIHWLQNNRNVTSDSSDQYQVRPIPTEGDQRNSTASELTIISAQTSNTGKYICVATNAVGVDPDIPPDYKPTITATKPKYTIQIGENAALSCVGEQVLESEFLTNFLFWELNGTKLNTSGDHYSVNNTFSHQLDKSTPKVEMRLHIFDVDWSDSGIYSCVVSSYRGSANATMNVEVKGKKRDNDKVWILKVVVAAVSFILALMVALLCYLVRRQRRRKRKMAYLAQKYAQGGPDYQFSHDVFVSYSSKDYDWVKDNLQPLFDGNNINYIIHSRDFIPGKAFFDNMADSVYTSRKVILVMSKNYLSSGFCKDEMHMALFRAARNDEKGSLIVVKIDDVKPQDIPKSLRHKTFIDYTSKEEAATWKIRILEFVSSKNRSLSVSADGELVGTSDTISLILNKFKLKRKKNQNVTGESNYQACE